MNTRTTIPEHFVAQDYLGADKVYYEPTEQGVEKKIKERLENGARHCPKHEKEVKMILNEQKAALRKEIRAAMKKIPPAARAAASAQLCARLKEQTFWKNAGSVLFFAPLPDETDIWPLLQETVTGGKIVALPRLDPATRLTWHAASKTRRTKSPSVHSEYASRSRAAPRLPLSRLDLILVPGVAFDVCGNRLGRGRGFYDRLLAEVCGVKCGLAFNEQIVPTIPVKAHDVRMDFIITPTRYVRIAG